MVPMVSSLIRRDGRDDGWTVAEHHLLPPSNPTQCRGLLQWQNTSAEPTLLRVSGCPITKSPLGKRTCKLRGHTQRAHMGAHVHGLKKPSHHSITKDKFWCRHVQTVYTIRQHTTPLCYTAHCHIVFSAAQECACAAWGKRFVKSEHGRFCFAVCNGLDKKSTLSAGHIDLLHSSKSLSWRCSWCQMIYFQAVSSVSAWLLQPGLPWFVLASKKLHLLQLDRNSQVRSKFSCKHQSTGATRTPAQPSMVLRSNLVLLYLVLRGVPHLFILIHLDHLATVSSLTYLACKLLGFLRPKHALTATPLKLGMTG